MWLKVLLVAAGLMLSGPRASADVQVLADPDQWIEQAIQDIAGGRTDDFARNYAKLIDNSDAFDSLASGLKVLTQIGEPAFIQKAVDQRFGEVLREIIYVGLYGQVDYMYFRFVVKKARDNGWIVSHFEFKHAPSDLFPKDFATSR